jgi:aromatic-amino-acid transaminase
MLAERTAKPYLPIEGSAAMRAAVQALLFGAGHPALAARVATLQTVGSSGGLKVGADFIKRWLPGSEVRVSDPTWDNHRAMFEGAGLAVDSYPYYDPGTGGLRFDACCAALAALPRRAWCCCTPAATTPPAWTSSARSGRR